MPFLLSDVLSDQIEATAPGVSALSLCIGGVQVCLSSLDHYLQLGIAKESESFQVEGGNADAEVGAAWGDLSRLAKGDLIFDSAGLWKLYRQGANYVFRFKSPAFGPLPYKQATFNSDFTSGEILLHADYYGRDEPARPLEYPLDEILVTNLLARGRGVEVHALGVRDLDGRGYLFLGHSGAGKTTSARLWEKAGVLILSDDRIILRALEGKIWMYGTPWHGEAELAASARTELTQIFVLGRGVKNETIPLRQPEAVSHMFTRSFVPFYNPAGMAFTLELLQKVAGAIPCAELRFVPDERVVEFVRENAR